MKLWHLFVVVLLVATVLAIGRSDVGRVSLIVFLTGLGEVACGTTALMLLFQTVGAIGSAGRRSAYVEAVAATALVLVVASVVMNSLFWAGIWLVQRVVRA